MTLGEHIVELTQHQVIDLKAQKPTTKRILRRCMPALREVVDGIASPEAGRMALPACYGRMVLFASPNRGMACDMLHWSEPIKEVPTETLDDKAGLWASLAAFIYRAESTAALAVLATRLGAKGIADFETSLANADAAAGQVIIQGSHGDTGLSTKGAMIVLAGVESGVATGIIGSLPVPVISRPGPVQDWHDDNWTRDSNHRRLH